MEGLGKSIILGSVIKRMTVGGVQFDVRSMYKIIGRWSILHNLGKFEQQNEPLFTRLTREPTVINDKCWNMALDLVSRWV
jgi:hypothetical protein